MDEADDFRLGAWRVEGGGKEGKFEEAGERPGRVVEEGEGVLR